MSTTITAQDESIPENNYTIADLSAYAKEELPGTTLLYKADELSTVMNGYAANSDVSSKNELSTAFSAIYNHLPKDLTNTATANTFLYSPSDEVSAIYWKEYIPEPKSPANDNTYLKAEKLKNDAKITLRWSEVNALPPESDRTSGLVLMSHGKHNSAQWETNNAIARSVGDIFYTTRTDVFTPTGVGKMINGAVPCNGQWWSNLPPTTNGIIDLLSSNVIPYVLKETFIDKVSAYGVCGCFGWDGKSNELYVPKLDNVFIEATNNSISATEYVQAGLPNITGSFAPPLVVTGASVSSTGAFNGENINLGNLGGKGVEAIYAYGHSFDFNAASGETKTDGSLKTTDEYHVYGKSDTVQPPAIRYIPMVQLYNTVDKAAIVKYDEIMNSIQAGHVLGEIFYTTRLDTLTDETSSFMVNGAVACNGQIRYCSTDPIPDPVPHNIDYTYSQTDYIKFLNNTIPGLLYLNKLRYVSTTRYDEILAETGGVCGCFGWDGDPTLDTNDTTNLSKYFTSDNFRKYRVPKLDKVFIEATNTNVSAAAYIQAGLPNITGKLGGQYNLIHGDEGTTGKIEGAFSATTTVSPAQGGGGTKNKPDVVDFNAASGETKTNGSLKTADEYHVYGKSNTVQPPAICYVPMVQIANKIEPSSISLYSEVLNLIGNIKDVLDRNV